MPIFLTGGVFECDLAHRRSVAVLCMLYKIRCNPLHPLHGPPYVPVRVTRGIHLCTSSLQNLAVSQDFYSLVSISVERPYGPRIRWCGTGWFQEQCQCLFIGVAASFLFVSCCFPFIFFHSMGWYCGSGVFGLIGC